jgi:hypothetical protein
MLISILAQIMLAILTMFAPAVNQPGAIIQVTCHDTYPSVHHPSHWVCRNTDPFKPYK